MAYTAEMIESTKPHTIGEVRRLAHALMYPNNLEGTHYVLMSRISPMHFVAGVFDDVKDAQAAMKAGKVTRNGIVRDLVDPYNPQIKDPFRIYEVEKTGVQAIEEMIVICWHDDYTEWWCPELMGQKFKGLAGLTEEMVDHFELKVILKNPLPGGGGTQIGPIQIPSNTDLICLREEALERFVYPQYATSVDREYAGRLRTRLRTCHYEE